MSKRQTSVRGRSETFDMRAVRALIAGRGARTFRGKRERVRGVAKCRGREEWARRSRSCHCACLDRISADELLPRCVSSRIHIILHVMTS
jgi:hypothetical protein